MKRLLLWLLDHFPFLVCWAFGILAANHRAELALEFFILAALFEIAGAITDLRRDVAKTRELYEQTRRAKEQAR